MNTDSDRQKVAIAEVVGQLQGYFRPLLGSTFCQSLERYLVQRIPTGSFLRACLENDFVEAMQHAHPSVGAQELKHLAFALSTFPEEAWGSKAKVQAWLDGEKGDKCHQNQGREAR